MNEGIDIGFVGAKIATRDNQAASVAVHALSASYNIAQIARYRAFCARYSKALCNGVQIDVDTMNQYRRELAKHTLLTGLDVVSLFLIGLSGRNE